MGNVEELYDAEKKGKPQRYQNVMGARKSMLMIAPIVNVNVIFRSSPVAQAIAGRDLKKCLPACDRKNYGTSTSVIQLPNFISPFSSMYPAGMG
jgi:hypothetical protein